MSLKTFVKIGNISNLSDARYCAGMMVDILGFNLEEGKEGFVTAEKFQEITEWIAGVDFCGEFEKAHINEIKLALEHYPINYVEVQDLDLLEELSEYEQKIIFKININSQSDLNDLERKCELVDDLVDKIIIASSDESLTSDILKKVARVKVNSPILRSFDINEKTAPSIIADELFNGIELVGTPEERPGYKDYGVVMDVLEVIEEE